MSLNEAMRGRWEARGLPRTAGSAGIACPPPVGYMRLYHLLSSEHGLSNIALQRLKVCRFDDVNDPFELISIKFKRDKEARRIVTAVRDQICNRTAVICFSRDWKNPLIWSHYADRHRGICIGLDVKEDEVYEIIYLNDKINLFEVDRSALNYFLMTRKFSDWKYEEEFRVFLDMQKDRRLKRQNHLLFCMMDSTLALREVILGLDNPLPVDDVRRLVDRLYDTTEIFTYKARRADGGYAIVPSEDSVKKYLQPPYL